MLSLLLLLGCTGDDPVLSGVPQATTAAEVRAKRERQEQRASPTNLEVTYTKPEGVYVDVRYLSGRAYLAVRGEVEAQLGALVEEKELDPDQGKELRFERATIRVKDGFIYMMDVALDPPVRRDEALRLLGFPDQAPREYIVLSGEYRANQVWDFRRIRFLRVAPQSELIDRVQAWKRDAGD